MAQPSVSASNTIQSSNPNFQCSLDGYNKMASDAFNALITPLNLIVEVLPQLTGYLVKLMGANQIADLNRSFFLAYDYFTQTLPGSLGYIIASGFYLAKHFGQGSWLCEAFGYTYYVIYYANIVNKYLEDWINSTSPMPTTSS